METIRKVNLRDKFSLINEYRSPKVVGELNGQAVKLVKMKGDFIWHHHEHEDEMFLVVKGKFRMGLKTGDIDVHEGEFIIIPRGVEHRPIADDEAQIILFEPTSTLNTGNIRNEFTSRRKLK